MTIITPAFANRSINLMIKELHKKKVAGLLHKTVGKQIRQGKYWSEGCAAS